MRVQVDTYNVYKFSELSEQAKERARDWYREVNNDDFSFHAECVISYAKEVAELLGITIDKIYYSGFSSQGDGACFTGSFDSKNINLKKLTEEYPGNQKLEDIALLLLLTKPLTATIEHRRHYYHEHSMDITCYGGDDEKPGQMEEVDILTDALRSFACWIYRRLESEWEYVNSSEFVDDAIECNEYEFTEEGERV